MLPIIRSFDSSGSIDDLNRAFDPLIDSYDPMVDHYFKGFYMFDPEKLDAHMLTLVGESIELKLTNRSLMTRISIHSSIRIVQVYAAISYERLNGRQHDPEKNYLTLGIFHYVRSEIKRA